MDESLQTSSNAFGWMKIFVNVNEVYSQRSNWLRRQQWLTYCQFDSIGTDFNEKILVLFQENAFDIFFCNCVVVLNLTLYVLIISLILQIAGILLSLLTKLGGDIGMVSIRPCVRASVHPSVCLSVPPGFPTIIWKSHHSIHFKFNVGICWASVQNWFAFGMTLAQFWPSSGQKMTENGPKWWFPIIISKSIHIIQFKLSVYTYWVSV